MKIRISLSDDSRPLAALALSGLAAALAACAPAQSSTAPPAPPPVTVQTPHSAALPESFEHVGRVEAMQQVDVRPRVAGQIVEIAFTEGAVAWGAVLLALIDAQRNRRAAALELAEAIAAHRISVVGVYRAIGAA